MIKLQDINKIFAQNTVNHNHAIKNINLTVNQGDFITVIGSNGAGKSTLFNLISGTLSSTSGTVFIDNNDVTKTPEYKRAAYLGRIFQNPLLGTAGGMTIEENMILASKKGMRTLKLSLNNKIRESFKEKLKLLDMNLDTRLKNEVGLLSGGQRQALTLLMMVLSEPNLILLDEHTAALDPKNAAIVMDLTRKFIKDYNLTAMMITHNMEHAIEYGNRLLMMDGGKIILDIKADEKKDLTVASLVEKFHNITNKNLVNDEILLSEEKK